MSPVKAARAPLAGQTSTIELELADGKRRLDDERAAISNSKDCCSRHGKPSPVQFRD
jgi:hypothetical protein